MYKLMSIQWTHHMIYEVKLYAKGQIEFLLSDTNSLITLKSLPLFMYM